MDRFIKNESVYKDVEACIEKAGGTSKFQFIAFAMIVCGMVCGAFILYCIAYFTKEPNPLETENLEPPDHFFFRPMLLARLATFRLVRTFETVPTFRYRSRTLPRIASRSSYRRLSLRGFTRDSV